MNCNVLPVTTVGKTDDTETLKSLLERCGEFDVGVKKNVDDARTDL